MEYAARDCAGVRGLKKLPDALVEAHVKLYHGYVANTNALRKAITHAKPGSIEFSELNRRMGWEFNGMRLHELYFEQLAASGGVPSDGITREFIRAWGSFDVWREQFVAMGMMRGVGWVITYRDPMTGWLSNHWIELHHEGHPAGFTPIVVMDVWEHAYTGMARAAYVDAFLDNLEWSVPEARLGELKRV